MEIEELVTAYKEIAFKIEELEKAKKVLSQSIMKEMTTKTVQVGNYMVRRYSRLSVRVSLENARVLDAIKIEETVDKDRIKEIYQQGQPIEGVSEIQYVTVSKMRDLSQEQVE